MALQVVADWQVHDHRDVVVLEVVGGSYPGQHQQLRRGHSPGAQDDLVVGVRDLVLAVVLVLNPVGPRSGVVSVKCQV